MLMIKNAYFCVAKVKTWTPEGKFYLILTGTNRLEGTFGVTRTMSGMDHNCDIYQLANRLMNISESIDDENGDISGKIDHINPALWKGDVCVSNVLLITSWNLGRQRVEQEFETLGLPQALHALESWHDVDMAFLFGGGFRLWEDDLEEGEEGDCENDMAQDQITDVSSNSLAEVISGDMDLEDHMATQACNKHSPFIELNGKKIHKAKVLREFFKYSMSPGSTDRLKHVAGLSCFSISTTGSSTTVLGHDESVLGNNCLCIGDPAVTLIRSSNHIFLTVIHVSQILIDSCTTFKTPVNMLVEPIVEVQFQILCLSKLALDSQSADDELRPPYDWTWNSQYIEVLAKTRGAFIQPVSPCISTKTLGKPTYLFKMSELCVLALSLFSSIPHDQHSILPVIKQQDSFPYCTSGKAAFVCEFDGSTTLSMADTDICPKCHPPLILDRTKPLKVIEHIGAHLLFDPTIDKAEEYCGLCFCLSLLCLFHFHKGKNHNSLWQIDIKRSLCPNLIDKGFSYGPASISLPNSPCTNVPMCCPHCPESASLVWKYSMTAHYTKNHPLASFPESIADGFVIGQAECTGLHVIWANQHKKKRMLVFLNLRYFRSIIPHSEKAYVQSGLEDGLDGPFSEDEHVQLDKSETEEQETIMITGEGSTPTASAPLTHPVATSKDNPEIDKAGHETEAPPCSESLLETTATENLFASHEMTVDTFTLDGAPT
ncbi:hypothetical protein APHAL10511_004967 [Amanita phalloides]|nr:hypothetical protein APHAL10511_004967 [Amanita phalloides]